MYLERRNRFLVRRWGEVITPFGLSRGRPIHPNPDLIFSSSPCRRGIIHFCGIVTTYWIDPRLPGDDNLKKVLSTQPSTYVAFHATAGVKIELFGSVDFEGYVNIVASCMRIRADFLMRFFHKTAEISLRQLSVRHCQFYR